MGEQFKEQTEEKMYNLTGVLREKIQKYLQHRRLLNFYSQFAKKGDICFDVGANMGNRTFVFRELGARVVVVEPQEECIEYMRRQRPGDDGMIFVQKAAGERAGEEEMRVYETGILSSLSDEWIDKVTESGRFSREKWTRTVKIPVTTLDDLIEEFGRPVFCKIDVEGYEVQVLKGLSRPIKFISFEFTPERREEAIKCLDILSGLGEFSFNYSQAESMRLVLADWAGLQEMSAFLSSLPVTSGDSFVWGDVYAKFIGKRA